MAIPAKVTYRAENLCMREWETKTYPYSNIVSIEFVRSNQDCRVRNENVIRRVGVGKR